MQFLRWLRQASSAGDLSLVCWGASFAARGAGEAAAAWGVAADELLAWCVRAPKRIRKRARVAARSAAVSAWTAAEAAARKTRKAQVIIARCLTAAALEQSTLVAGAAAAAALAAAAGALLASLTPGSSGSQRRKRKKQREEADWVAWQADAAGEKIRRMYWERDVLPVWGSTE